MNDLISRQAAIDAILAVTGNSSVRELYEHVQEHGLSNMWSGGVNAAIDTIIAVPSAEPERKTGHWKFDWKHNKATCSECGHTFRDAFDIDDFDNFCRHCGAYMTERRSE